MNPDWFHLSGRKLVSFTLFFSFLGSAVSGTAMYLRPEGSLARWTGWRFLWLDKKHWEAVHIVMVAVFLLAALVHILNNHRALLGYLRRAAGTAWSSRREGFVSLLFVALLLAAALANWPPASHLVRLRAGIREGKRTAVHPPPSTDADMLPLARLAEQLDIPVETVILRLQERGIEAVTATVTLRDLSVRNHCSPQFLFLLCQDK